LEHAAIGDDAAQRFSQEVAGAGQGTGRAFEIVPGPHDGVADDWGVADAWTFQYRGSEIDDGGATGGPTGDAAHMSDYVNGESVNGRDVVLWYRAGHRHDSGIGCEMVGPTLRPRNSW
jgi:hypothetical protein